MTLGIDLRRATPPTVMFSINIFARQTSPEPQLCFSLKQISFQMAKQQLVLVKMCPHKKFANLNHILTPFGHLKSNT